MLFPRLTSLSSLVALLALSVQQVKADFHVLGVSANGGSTHFVACPSNQMDCSCYVHNHATGHVNGDPQDQDFFQVEDGLCGMPELNFYLRDDGHWDLYVAGGDGEVLGTCYPNTGETFCQDNVIVEQLVCYTYICNP
jgi:hypothetical protein